MKKKIIEKLQEIKREKEPKNKGVTIKLKQSEYEKIKKFCEENNIRISDLIGIKIKEVIEEID
jgi:16S rRNA U516 pseudouridylate synthase RsuA-like enzyme